MELVTVPSTDRKYHFKSAGKCWCWFEVVRGYWEVFHLLIQGEEREEPSRGRDKLNIGLDAESLALLPRDGTQVKVHLDPLSWSVNDDGPRSGCSVLTLSLPAAASWVMFSSHQMCAELRHRTGPKEGKSPPKAIGPGASNRLAEVTGESLPSPSIPYFFSQWPELYRGLWLLCQFPACFSYFIGGTLNLSWHLLLGRCEPIQIGLELSQETSRTIEAGITFVIPAFRRLREDDYEFRVSLDYLVDTVLKIKKDPGDQLLYYVVSSGQNGMWA